MKNTILTFFLIIPLISIAAKYYPGKAVKTDGTELIGYFEEPDFAAVKKIKFKSSLDSKKQKFLSVEFSTLEFTKGEELVKYEVLYYMQAKFLNFKKLKVSKKPIWFKVIEKNIDGVSIYVAWGKSNDGRGNISYSMTSYMKLPDEKELKYLQYEGSSMTEIKIGFYKAFTKIIDYYFKDSCPELLTHVTKDLYKEKGVLMLTELYKEHCK
ncbi:MULTISPECIES: hypothetical protein [Nonlabens]|uniref:Uncharacterized protein n=2 Tax=Nonlabens ulvanivorans TaxID=906888 RepID=A0A084JU12_NONUL|nr:hypothetical protein [Nonlabens ulvanivorans]KEZ92446.1 hypothetical protein IL45_09850 [Nonlabens ulvanivorans]PRX15282.1 hypothetical protein LY02_00497 [Nonlabens ulvanivorans]